MNLVLGVWFGSVWNDLAKLQAENCILLVRCPTRLFASAFPCAGSVIMNLYILLASRNIIRLKNPANICYNNDLPVVPELCHRRTVKVMLKHSEDRTHQSLMTLLRKNNYNDRSVGQKPG